MSMTRDAGHQSLDINIGRAVELFLENDIPMDVARENICKHFHGKHVAENRASLDTYVTNVLEMVRTGELEPVQARNGFGPAEIISLSRIYHGFGLNLVAAGGRH